MVASLFTVWQRSRSRTVAKDPVSSGGDNPEPVARSRSLTSVFQSGGVRVARAFSVFTRGPQQEPVIVTPKIARKSTPPNPKTFWEEFKDKSVLIFDDTCTMYFSQCDKAQYRDLILAINKHITNSHTYFVTYRPDDDTPMDGNDCKWWFIHAKPRDVRAKSFKSMNEFFDLARDEGFTFADVEQDAYVQRTFFNIIKMRLGLTPEPNFQYIDGFSTDKSKLQTDDESTSDTGKLRKYFSRKKAKPMEKEVIDVHAIAAAKANIKRLMTHRFNPTHLHSKNVVHLTNALVTGNVPIFIHRYHHIGDDDIEMIYSLGTKHTKQFLVHVSGHWNGLAQSEISLHQGLEFNEVLQIYGDLNIDSAEELRTLTKGLLLKKVVNVETQDSGLSMLKNALHSSNVIVHIHGINRTRHRLDVTFSIGTDSDEDAFILEVENCLSENPSFKVRLEKQPELNAGRATPVKA